MLIPRLSALAAGCLAALMVGAVVTHARFAEWPMMLVAATIMLLSAYRAWAGRGQVLALVGK